MISAFGCEVDEIISLRMAFGCVRRNGSEHGSLYALTIVLFMDWRKNKLHEKR
jgi:hypothetical protein